jgi:hypothetical protein
MSKKPTTYALKTVLYNDKPVEKRELDEALDRPAPAPRETVREFATRSEANDAYRNLAVRGYHVAQVVRLTDGKVMHEKRRCRNCGDPMMVGSGVGEREHLGWCASCYQQRTKGSFVVGLGKRVWKDENTSAVKKTPYDSRGV